MTKIRNLIDLTKYASQDGGAEFKTVFKPGLSTRCHISFDDYDHIYYIDYYLDGSRDEFTIKTFRDSSIYEHIQRGNFYYEENI